MNRLPSSRPALLLTLGLLSASAAWAQTNLVALHPCAIIGIKDKARIEEFQTICTTEISRSNIQLVPSDQVRGFLDKEAKGSCARGKDRERQECLGKLATSTQAVRAILITVEPGQLTRVSGLVVNAQGEVVDQKSIQIRNRGKPEVDVVRTAVTRLREQLSIAPVIKQPPAQALAQREAQAQARAETEAQLLAQLEAHAQAEARAKAEAEAQLEAQAQARAKLEAQAAAPAPEPAPPSTGLSALLAGRSWKTPTAYATAGAGVVALGLATVFALQSTSTLEELDAPYRNGGLPPKEDLPRLAELRDRLGTQRTVAAVSTAVGAALVGTGVYLWLSDRPGPTTTPGATALSVGPGGVSVRVLLP